MAIQPGPGCLGQPLLVTGQLAETAAVCSSLLFISGA
jgi:hypothetical protein